MSRTYKDRPKRVVGDIAMRNGLTNHDHAPPKTTTTTETIDLTKMLWKRDAAAINAYREHLATIDDISVEEVETLSENLSVPDFEWRTTDLWSDPPPPSGDKVVVFVVRKKVTTKTESEECTDADHYDYIAGVDVRDGGSARCLPDFKSAKSLIKGKHRRRYRDMFDYDHGPDRRSLLQRVARGWSRGDDVDDLDEDCDVEADTRRRFMVK